jgi:hypothetical protein
MIDVSQNNLCYLMPFKWRDLNATAAVFTPTAGMFQYWDRYM